MVQELAIARDERELCLPFMDASVEQALKRMLRKLNVSARTELVARLQQMEL